MLDGKNIIIDKGVGPNKHVGRKFSKNPINVQLGCVLENLSKITWVGKNSYENWKFKAQNSQFTVNQTIQPPINVLITFIGI